MAAPLRGTQTLVGQMGWVFDRPLLIAIEVAWRWIFGVPVLVVCWIQAQKVFVELPLESAGLGTLDPQNPWVAAEQLRNAWTLYLPHVAAVACWLLPVVALAWVVASGLGRNLILMRMILQSEEGAGFSEKHPSGAKAHDNIAAFTARLKSCPDTKQEPQANRNPNLCPDTKPGSRFDTKPGLWPDVKQCNSATYFRPIAMMRLQAAWLVLFVVMCWGWYRAIAWVASTTITPGAEADLVGFSVGVIFLSLGFFTAWALVSWALSIAPLVMLLEGRSALSALGQSLRLGRPMTGKLVEINMVMGIVKLALIVVAMVLSAAPLPFGDQLGEGVLHWITGVALIFYFVGNNYFQVVRLKGFVEFWKMYRSSELAS